MPQFWERKDVLFLTFRIIEGKANQNYLNCASGQRRTGDLVLFCSHQLIHNIIFKILIKMILILLFFLLILALYYYITQEQRLQQVWDVIIVGAGISGTYIAYRLSQKYPNIKILVLEKETSIGGRLLSINPLVEPSPIKIEVGGMRFFPALQPKIGSLVQELNLIEQQIPYESPPNLAYLRGLRFPLNTIAQRAQDVYNLYPNEKNKTPTQLVVSADMSAAAAANINVTDVYSSPTFNNMSYWFLLEQYLSNEAVQLYRDSGGYNFTVDNISASVGVIEDTDLGQSGSTQTMIATGYQSLVTTLANRCPKTNVTFLTNTNVIKFTYNQQFSVVTSNQTFTSKSLWLTVLPEQLQNLYNWSTDVKLSLTKLVPWSAIKIFLSYQNTWWTSTNIQAGRNVTDIPLRQLWMYSPNTLLVYCDDNSVRFWLSLLPTVPTSGSEYRPAWIPANNAPVLVAEIQKQIKLLLGIDNPPPQYILWRYWNVGAHWWAPSNISQNRTILSRPLGSAVNCYISNSSYSLSQGWVEGSLEQADSLLSTLN